MQRIIEGLIRENDGERVPVIVFTKGGGAWLEAMSKCGCDCVGVDWTVNLTKARARTGDKVSLQGNLDPMVLFAGEEAIRREVRRVIDSFGTVGNGGHVFNLGHGVPPTTDPDVLTRIDELVRELGDAR